MNNKSFKFKLNECKKIDDLIEQLNAKNIDFIETSLTGDDITIATEGHYLYLKFHSI